MDYPAVIVSTVAALAGVLVGGGVNYLLQRASATREAARDERRMKFEHAERRYADLRDAYRNFETEMTAQRRKLERHEEKYHMSPAEWSDDTYELPIAVDDALSLLRPLAPMDTRRAAFTYAQALHDAINGRVAIEDLNVGAHVFDELTHRDLTEWPREATTVIHDDEAPIDDNANRIRFWSRRRAR